MPSESNGGGFEGRFRGLEILVTELMRETERLATEFRAVLAAQMALEEKLTQVSLKLDETSEKLDGQIGFTDLFRDEVGARLKDIETKLSER